MRYDQAVQLCRSARRDLRRLMAALDTKSFYDLGHEVGHAASLGEAFRGMDKELVWLEQLITVENLPALRQGKWSIYDLVNYYDGLIDLIKIKGRPTEGSSPLAESLLKWRDNAGKLAQIVCQLEDDEGP